ncbi:MAG TPA: 50S ribosomal protein L13 [bacterium]|nr:50S ribosomal protein L13 [bacterium]
MGLTKSFIKEKTPRKWVLIDLKGQVLGRAASQIAMILRGKTKANFTPHQDTGDFVVAINARDIRLTGNKMKEKMYYHHSEYIGGLKEYTAEKLLERHPEDLIYRAVKGMLPKTFLGKKQLKKLKIYAGEAHPHASQTPEVLALRNRQYRS